MASAKNKAPNAPRGNVGRGVPSPPGEGAMPPSAKMFRFLSSKWQDLCILGANFIAVKLPVLHA